MRKGIRLYTSNRMEILADLLSQVLRDPLSSPLEQEIIVVQSTGMERWLRMELALHHGVCANVRFPFPNMFIRDISRRVMEDIPQGSAFEPEILIWRIFALLPGCIKELLFESVRSYLENKRGDLKQYQLAAAIADLFDQYLIFRPDMIFSWENGEGKHWQAMLWRKLVKGKGETHRAALHRRLIEVLKQKTVQTSGVLPARVSIFGISTLPPFHLQVLSALSRSTEVNLFLMNPCREYWGEIFSAREKDVFLKRTGQEEKGEKLLHLEEGNSLLASYGILGRNFFDMLSQLECEEEQHFEERDSGTMLQIIQSDILNLRDRGSGGQKKAVLSPGDQSIQIHSCHSPMREMEVLYDQILSFLEKYPALEPRNILVMAPDIEQYAPFVQAVFGSPEKEQGRIPFSISDRSPTAENILMESYLSLLDLSPGRFTATDVLGLLECPSISKNFGLSEQNLSEIQEWTWKSGIRWGRDGAHRQSLGLPSFSENTWRFGLDRLLLGYAMPGSKNDRMFKGILPFDRIEGADALTLGRLAAFLDILMSCAKHLNRDRTLAEWSQLLTDILDSFFSGDEPWERDTQMIRQALFDLVAQAETATFFKKVSLDTIKEHLRKLLAEKSYSSGFITGGVTFCSMLPMRSIPFKVICLVGMNSDAYPRQTRKLGFDLMARRPRQGDRSRRNDDRYLFLETILSARKLLYMSYLGQSIEDNSTIPPSVLVSELMDYLEQNFQGAEFMEAPLCAHLLVRHRLQAFSPAYFTGDEKYFSYSKENLDAARQKLLPPTPPPAFIPSMLSPPGDQWKSVDLTSFLDFFLHPAKFILRERLGIILGQKGARIQETEPFKLTPLEQYKLNQKLVNRRITSRQGQDVFHVFKAEGSLPHGTVGECTYERLRQEADIFSQKVLERIAGAPPRTLEVEISLNSVLVKGIIEGIYPAGLLQYRYAKVKAKDYIALWVKHLLVNRSQDENITGESTLLAANGSWIYSPVDSARSILERMGELFLSGLEKPLPFFPNTSFVYAKIVLNGKKPEIYAMEKARATWRGDEYRPGEGAEEYYQLCFRDKDPLDEAFRSLAVEFWAPLLSAMKKIR